MTGFTGSIRLPRKPAGTASNGFGVTRRRDRWWTAPVVQGTVFTICATYLFFSGIIWTPLFGTAYLVDGYLSPLFSPLIRPDWLPTWISPGLFILWIPLGFRATCYYYRKAYYRFYFADPPGCAVGEPTMHRGYSMETAFPFILQNLHRYFLYLAFIPLFFLWLDAWLAITPRGHRPARRGRRDPRRERVLPDRLFAVVPFAAPPHGRQARLLLVFAARAGPLLALAAADVPEPEPHAVGVDQPDHRDRVRPVHPAHGARHDQRPTHPLLNVRPTCHDLTDRPADPPV